MDSEQTGSPREIAPGATRASLRIGIGLAAMIVVAWGIYSLLKTSSGPPPAAIAEDPLLVQGRTIYLSRCVSCHGERGRGDGPLSKGLTGPKPRDFLADEWKYGTRPEQAFRVVSEGVPGTSMGAWKSSYSPEELRAATAYVYYLAEKPVPPELRRE